MPPQIRTILLVEDDSNDARLLQRAFEKAGVDVPLIRVVHGDDAVAYLGGEDQFVDRSIYPMPGLVLLDLKLPRRSGFEVLQWLRACDADCRLLPVVILSSAAEASDINRCYALGANSYLTKPNSTEEFHQLAASFREYWLRLNREPTVASQYC